MPILSVGEGLGAEGHCATTDEVKHFFELTPTATSIVLWDNSGRTTQHISPQSLVYTTSQNLSL